MSYAASLISTVSRVRLPDEAAAEHVGVQRAHEHADPVERQPGGHGAPAGIAQHVLRQPRRAARLRSASRSPAGCSALGQPQARFDRAGQERQARKHAAHPLPGRLDGWKIRCETPRRRSASSPLPARCSAARPTAPGSRRAGRCRGNARAPRPAAAGCTSFSRNSTSLPGFTWWLESMNRMSFSPSAANGPWCRVSTWVCSHSSSRPRIAGARLGVDRGDAGVEACRRRPRAPGSASSGPSRPRRCASAACCAPSRTPQRRRGAGNQSWSQRGAGGGSEPMASSSVCVLLNKT